MKKERPYQFREFLEQVHRPGRRSTCAAPLRENETLLDETWEIRLPVSAEDGVKRAALDFQDYLFTSMNLSLRITAEGRECNVIQLQSGGTGKSRAYVYECAPDRIVVRGDSWIGVQQGLYYLEDLMNLRELPALEHTEKPVRRAPLFSPRMVHSGYGLDQFPDSQLSAIAHAGFDAILIFATGPDMTRQGPLDFNDIIHRALLYGLDTYFYSYLDGYKHPDESDADAFFDSRFGALFRHSPEAKGIILVSESCEFPTRDPRANAHKTTEGTNEYTQGICGHKSGSGWWPCSDYPQWVNAVKKACRRYNPEADVVFWTYGFGRAPAEPQREMILNYPKDASLLVTFEMYEQRRFENHTAMQCDYSITFPGPSRMFRVEAEAAAEAGVRLYSMTNTAGRTWDNGVCPYEPVPQQWFKRFAGIHEAREKWNLSGLMDSHHYGWYPSVVCECAKWSFWSPTPDMNELLHRIAVRDFGGKGAEAAVAAWQKWSDAIASYTPGFDDQAGPLRIGPAYPFIFQPNISRVMANKEIKFPTAPHAHFGYKIIKTLYQPYENENQSPGPLRYPVELRDLEKMLSLWEKGLASLEQALAQMDRKKRVNGERLYALGKFIRNAVRTVIHMKNWWMLNIRLQSLSTREEMLAVLDQIEAVAKEEVQNVLDTIPCVETDSRIGWEPFKMAFRELTTQGGSGTSKYEKFEHLLSLLSKYASELQGRDVDVQTEFFTSEELASIRKQLQ